MWTSRFGVRFGVSLLTCINDVFVIVREATGGETRSSWRNSGGHRLVLKVLIQCTYLHNWWIENETHMRQSAYLGSTPHFRVFWKNWMGWQNYSRTRITLKYTSASGQCRFSEISWHICQYLLEKVFPCSPKPKQILSCHAFFVFQHQKLNWKLLKESPTILHCIFAYTLHKLHQTSAWWGLLDAILSSWNACKDYLNSELNIVRFFCPIYGQTAWYKITEKFIKFFKQLFNFQFVISNK